MCKWLCGQVRGGEFGSSSPTSQEAAAQPPFLALEPVGMAGAQSGTETQVRQPLWSITKFCLLCFRSQAPETSASLAVWWEEKLLDRSHWDKREGQWELEAGGASRPGHRRKTQASSESLTAPPPPLPILPHFLSAAICSMGSSDVLKSDAYCGQIPGLLLTLQGTAGAQSVGSCGVPTAPEAAGGAG